MGYKKTDPCLQKAHADEKLFVLMARDVTSPKVIMEWIKENLGAQPEDKLREAFECALEMQKRSGEFNSRKALVKEGWTFMVDAFPPDESTVEVLTINGDFGGSAAWISKSEGWRNKSNSFYITAWRNTPTF